MASGRASFAEGHPVRIFRHPDTPRITFTLDGETIEAFENETLLAALMSARGWSLRQTECAHTPRGMFCGMGVCMDCVVHVEGEGIVRACMFIVRQGLVCRTLIPAEDAGYPID